ncbi:MAG TPA: FkbM family methyltransferase, partial [Cyclobacteriaceae bacterium]
FEPDSDSFDSLQKSVNRNEFKNIKLFKTALGAEAGTAELFKVYVNNPGANRILSQKPDKETKSEIVEIATLDSFYQKEIFKKIDLIKIDVEGFELFVLRGARQLIDKWKPILFIELADVNLKQQNCSAVEVIEFVEGLGYHVLDAQTMLPIERKTTEYYTDIVCFSGDK